MKSISIRRVTTLLSLPNVTVLSFLLMTGHNSSADPKSPIFQNTRESLEQYQTPDWFRDAKFGIWSHWGPQAVPRQGDWYARNMYIQGSRQNQFHVAHYGPPSQFGYKNLIPLWKAGKWQPEQLMDLYAKAGAKYFVSMGVHHDNFDLWNSKYHSWNAVEMGPHRDVVGQWQAAALKHGLRFGVSEHLGASYAWFQTSHGSDKTGPLAGVLYDGADPKYQDLYHAPDTPFNGDIRTWYTSNQKAQQDWDKRIRDLIDTYHPDLLYSDGGIPFGDLGRGLLAHFYNSNRERHNGRLEAVYNHKDIGSGEFIAKAGVQDVERGGMPGITPLPWQTDTSIGDWFYSENYRYKTADQVIHSLADIVSKNGNLLLNVVQYPDGSLPPESLQFLQEMGQWIPVNGEAIYGTRPWTIYGEGPTQAKSGNFSENFPFTPRDIRFTTKAGNLYAMTLGVPTNNVVIKALAADSPLVSGQLKRVTLLGYSGKLVWKRTAAGLEIQLPEKLPSHHSLAFKLSGLKTVENLTPQVIRNWTERINQVEDIVVTPNAQGRIELSANAARLHGTLHLEGSGPNTNIGFWDQGKDFVSWKLQPKEAGIYRIEATTSSENQPTEYVVSIDAQKVVGKFANTGSWTNYVTNHIGEFELKAENPVELRVRAADPANWHAMNLRSLRLIKITPGN